MDLRRASRAPARNARAAPRPPPAARIARAVHPAVVPYLDPLKGIARMFSPNALAEVAKSLLKVGWLGLVALAVGHALQADVLSLGQLPVALAVRDALALLVFALVMLSIALLPIAAIDAPHQLWQHLGKLRMTRQEVRDERKETDGDPELKNRVRQQQRTLAQRRMMQDVPHADVVITNPTHFAVALRYDPRGHGAPVVVAKGADRIAEHIRALARGNDVPLFEAPPLARAVGQRGRAARIRRDAKAARSPRRERAEAGRGSHRRRIESGRGVQGAAEPAA